MPERLQRSRAKGWRMPSGCIYVGRPTVWGNPYGLKGTACLLVVDTIEEAVEEFRKMVEAEMRAAQGALVRRPRDRAALEGGAMKARITRQHRRRARAILRSQSAATARPRGRKIRVKHG